MRDGLGSVHHQAMIDLATDNIIDQFFRVRDGTGSGTESQLGQVFLHLRHLLHVFDRVLGQTDLLGKTTVEPLTGSKQGA